MEKPENFTDICNLTAEDVLKASTTERRKLLPDLFKAIEYAECKAQGWVHTLRKKIDYFEQPGVVQPWGGIEDMRRQDWEINQLKIKQCIRNHTINTNGLPSIAKIADNTGLSRVTVYKHLEAGLAGGFMQEHLKMYESLTVDVLQLLYMQALEGSPAAAKIYIDSVLKISQLNQAPGTTIRQQNNYVQVNNTRIDEMTINQLPDTAREQIEAIINQYETAKKAVPGR